MEIKMKKILVMLCCSIFLMTACGMQKDIDFISDQLNIKIDNGEIISSLDEHGGMGNDGTTLIKVKIEDDDFANKLEQNQQWTKEPSKFLKAILYGYDEGSSGYGPFIADDDDNPLLPTFNNAYYYIFDKNDEDGIIEGLEAFETLSPINVIIGIYDIDNSILYYCEEDT